ncbi:hypothetical protein DQ384_25425 [Sphaerisporangium album]|uniref:DUF8094 domain-containing protein n=1 Tax=Sphaerisporangium album TaxID=509200 RepID=A0A367FC84_9ACTN|nr:hypothetical protein [Sphaerisporangium album]RCG27871.1 hypothetical protein DQ384_25425 [Sphaerisporangium album]
MLRRLAALAIGVVLLPGCGARDDGPPVGTPSPANVATSAPTVGPDEAATAFGLLRRLDDAWSGKDCAEVAFLTASPESGLGGRACEATRNGRPVPASLAYGDVDYYIPGALGGRPWFVALAHRPHPSYFLFEHDEGRWRLALGPIRLVGDAPELDVDETQAAHAVPADDPEDGVRARLAPQKHLAYLSDPAGLSGVRFASGDAMTRLLAELVRKPSQVRPDRLGVDVRLVPGETRALALAGGGALVFHALQVVYSQRARTGKVAHPVFGAAAVRAFTGKASPKTVTATELILLATTVAPDGRMTTVALRRTPADITAT